MRNNFVVMILTHGRPNNVCTYKTLKKQGYTGKIIIVVDNEDNTIEGYHANFGEENVYVFCKKSVASEIDEGDNFKDRRAIVYARNACFKIANELGYKNFIQMDDDYTRFENVFNNEKDYITRNTGIKNLDNYFDLLCDFLNKTSIKSVCMAQSGDFIGGLGTVGKKYVKGEFSRKAMNSFFCSTDKPFCFNGRLNEDVNTYTSLQSRGSVFITFGRLRLQQKPTQKNKGGMTDIYCDNGTYIKSFYSVMFMPSAVKISKMGVNNFRLHHKVKWNNTAPLILPETLKKK